MKNLILTMTAGLILLTGCSKDDSTEQINNQTTNPIIVLEHESEIDAFSTIELNSFQAEESNLATFTNEYYGFSRGLYKPNNRNSVILSWKGDQNGTRSFGTAELQITRPDYTIHVLMETECVNVEGEAAMYGSTITEVKALSGNAPPLTENWRFYFVIKDNDITSIIDYDQISNRWIFASPRTPSLCGLYSPNDKVWSTNGYQDVTNPGYVEVSDQP